jgi:hypothetical protein
VRNLLILIATGILENLGFRQLLAIWRAQAFLDVLRGKTSWGAMERRGFQPTARSSKAVASAELEASR